MNKLNKYPEALLLYFLNFIFMGITHNYKKKSNITTTTNVNINTYTFVCMSWSHARTCV